MFIAKSKIEFNNLEVFEKTYNIPNEKFILCRDGILYNQIKAGLIEVVAEIPEVEEFFKDKLKKDYLILISDKALNSREYFVAMYGEKAYIDKVTRVNVNTHPNKNKESKDDGNDK